MKRAPATADKEKGNPPRPFSAARARQVEDSFRPRLQTPYTTATGKHGQHARVNHDRLALLLDAFHGVS